MAKILIADDSKVQKVQISKFLIKHGHEVLEAKNGNEAIDKTLEYKPDLILMDIVMPECNGFKALREIKKNKETAHIPVIMVSTKKEELDILWADKQGADGYITKPVNFNLLEEEINKNLK